MRRRPLNLGAIVAIIAMIAFFAWVVLQMAGHRHGSLGTNLVIKIAIGFGAAAIGLGIGAGLTAWSRRNRSQR